MSDPEERLLEARRIEHADALKREVRRFNLRLRMRAGMMDEEPMYRCEGCGFATDICKCK